MFPSSQEQHSLVTDGSDDLRLVSDICYLCSFCDHTGFAFLINTSLVWLSRGPLLRCGLRG